MWVSLVLPVNMGIGNGQGDSFEGNAACLCTGLVTTNQGEDDGRKGA